MEKVVGKYLKRLNVLKIILCISLLSWTLFSCAQKNKQTNDLITSQNVKEIISDSLNLVFLTAEWCSASKSVLKKNYSKICDSLSDRINVVIICASETDNQFANYLEELGISCGYYLLPNKQSHEKVLEHGDRKRIRHFIKKNFIGYEDLNLEWQFGIPVSLYVNQKLEIISNAPWEYKSIEGDIVK